MAGGAGINSQGEERPLALDKGDVSNLVRRALDLEPRPLKQLQDQTGLTAAQVQAAIGTLRALDIAIWSSHRGFWADGSTPPAPETYRRWKKEPPTSA